MFSNITSKYLGIEPLSPQGKSLAYRYAFFSAFSMIIVNLTLTFWILFEIEVIGAYKASILGGWTLLLVILLDYPTGALGDYLGQRWILFLAYLFWTSSSVLLVIARTPLDFFIVHTLSAIAGSQESGAIFSWLDNNYNALESKDDSERTVYGTLVSRVDTLTVVVSIPAMMLGGTLSVLFNRRVAFATQAVLTFIFCLLIPFLLLDWQKKSEKNDKENTHSKKNRKSYFKILKEGLNFTVSSRYVLLAFMGMILLDVSRKTYSRFLRPIIFFEYAGNDFILTVARTIYFATGVILGYKVASLSQKISKKRVILSWSLFSLFSTMILFGGMLIIIKIFTPTTQFEPIPLILLILLVIFHLFLGSFSYIMRRRFLNSIVPNHIRNSMYSLIPSASNLASLLVFPLVGLLLEQRNYEFLLLLVLGTSILGSFIIYTSKPCFNDVKA